MKKRKLTKKSIIKMIIILTIVSIIIGIYAVIKTKKTEKKSISSELQRTQAYKDVKDGDNEIEDEEGNILSSVKFDAFFLKDKDGDGVAESIRGTCNEIGNEANLYMELSVLEEGYLTNGKITINSDNFCFNTSIVKDDEIKENYISTNTKEINLNNIENGTQKLLIGSIRSGDYSSSYLKTSAIGNDINKYSKENSITFSGTFVDYEGNEKNFTKTTSFIVDWYGETNVEIYPKVQTTDITNIEDLLTDDGLELKFEVKTLENKNELNISSSEISGTIPELNGYKAKNVKISGTNVTYTYDEETGNFTAKRTAVVNESGKILSNGYSYSDYTTKYYYRYTKFEFDVIYPIEAYTEMGIDTASFELAIPIEAVTKGYNNPNTKDGFSNPYVSNTATGIVTTTWRKKTGDLYDFEVYVGKYMGEPYYSYVVSKEKPLNIYNGISSEEKDDTYVVQWIAYTGTGAVTDGIIMNETTNKTDEFLNTSAKYETMENLTTNVGIYFSGASNMLKSDGWIKVYDADTDTLLKTFTLNDWNKYSSTKPYKYKNSIKRIRVETSSTNEESSLFVYNVKELDDEYITTNYTRADFDKLSYIYSYLDGYMIKTKTNENEETTYCYKTSEKNKALYEAPTSVATIAIKENTISTHATAEHQKITISANTSGYNEQKWKNGVFLVQIPSEVNFAEINEVTIDNENVKITAYDLYEENENYYIKILTENSNEESYDIVIDCNLTPDPRITKTTKQVKLWAINEIACDYYYNGADIYDIDGDLNITEMINYKETSLTFDPGSSLSTTQIGSNYGEEGEITIAPRVAKTDKNQRTATITISTTNNYTYDIQDVSILGVVPFEGNKYIISGNDLESTFTTYMKNSGISAISNNIKDKATIYYSTTERPSKDLNDASNGWKLAENIDDWSKVKTYLIVLDNSYKLASGEKIEFEYDIQIPQGIDYNEVSYSEHAIYFALNTDEGLYYTSTGSAKLGFMIAKQYDLEIVKYQTDTEKTLQGITFAVTEDGADTSTIKITDKDGKILITGLYVERYYTIKEIKTTDDYVLNDEEIKFYTYTKINENGSESLYLTYPGKENERTYLNSIYTTVQADEVIQPSTELDYRVQIKINNDVKAKLKINKTNQLGEALKNVKFTLTGQDIDEILTTDSNGQINVSGLYLDKEYTLEEIKATGYYIPQSKIKFSITNNNGSFELNYTDNGTTKTKQIVTDDEIPTINLNLQNEKIPTYSLKLTKYAKDEKDNNGNDKTLKKAQYLITGEGIKDGGKSYATDENGVLTIDNLYEYVSGKYITGEYTIKEIYAPEGYSLNATELKFKAYKEKGTLKIQIIEGESVIREIVQEGSNTSEKDLNIENASSSTPVIKIGVEDGQIFSIYKFYKDGTSSAKRPIAGTRFKITDLKGKYVTGSDGNIVGEWFESSSDKSKGYYAVTTDSNGQITANLPEGYYKAIEIYTDDKFVLPENEEDRTYYFGIGSSRAETYDWVKGISGQGWNYINSVASENDGGVIAVGSFSKYSSDIVENSIDGIDIDNDGNVDKISEGNNDGLIISYDEYGNISWAKTFGGDEDDSLNKVIQTSDGGFVAVGYAESNAIKYNGTIINEISRSSSTDLALKDAILLKLDKNGNYQWGLRIGGTGDDEIQSVIETSQGNIVITGNYFGTTFNFYNRKGTDVKASITNDRNRYAFIASYSNIGEYQWSQNIDGSDGNYGNNYVDAPDVIEYSDGLAVLYNITYCSYLRQYSLNGDKLRLIASTYWTKMTSLATLPDGSFALVMNGDCDRYQSGSTIYKATTQGIRYPLYSLSGSDDEYISEIKATSDGGIVFCGWSYSNDMVGSYYKREEKDETTFLQKNDNACDGFVMKVDSDGNLEYSSRLYGDNYDVANTVTECKDGTFVVGGSFNSSTLSATNCKIEKDEDDPTPKEQLLVNERNSNAYVIKLGAANPIVAEAQRLEIENKIKTFKITTEVKKKNEIFGGDIDGQTDVTIDDIEYSKDGIRYVEKVKYGENSQNTIKITPDENYVIESITINGKEYINFEIDSDGTVTVPIFEDVKEDKHIIVQFSNTISNIEVNHYLWTADKGITNIKVADTKTSTGEIGTNYETLPESDIEYVIITNADYYGDDLPEGLNAEDYYIPDNYKGTYIDGTKQVINYYYKEKTYKLTVHHYIDGTNEQVPLKGSKTDEKVPDEISTELKKNSEYSTTQASESKIDYSIYELVSLPQNASGTIEEDTEVIYYYKIKTADIKITKVAEEDYEKTLSDTEFRLYEFVGTTSENQLIDTKNVGSDWNLVGTYITADVGLLKLEDLQINKEYRLVEVKASDGRITPDGQWKVQFVTGSYDSTDISIVTMSGVPFKINAVGNPPAMIKTDDGRLLLPNKEYYNFPVSGGIGIKTIYKTGIIAVIFGLLLMVLTKFKKINIKKKWRKN